ncbi:Monopolin complex subunit Csm1/Pcs1 [Penicillium chermesinum]|nr:Monopolin complex subunit Csm1/Pcs1 [Penicillium chermesinum]
MPKRKAPTKANISGLVGSDDEDLMQMDSTAVPPQESRDEPPAKKRRGRPRTSNDTADAKSTQTKKRESSATAQGTAAAKRPGRRGRPRGSSRTSETDDTNAQAPVTQEPKDSYEQENEDPQAAPAAKATRATNSAKLVPAATRRGGRAPNAAKTLEAEDEFQYTPTSARQFANEHQAKNARDASPRPSGAQRRKK